MRHVASTLAAAALLGGSASPATAYQRNMVEGGIAQHWPDDFVLLYYPSEFFDSPEYYNAAIDTVGIINNNPSMFSLDLALDDDDDQSSGNGESEITWTDDAAVLGGAPARALWWVNDVTGEMLEADVFFDRNYPWTESDRKRRMTHYGGSDRPFQTAMLHELGHVAGLAHEDGVYNVMGQEWTHTVANGAFATPHLGSDAAAGLVATYGVYGLTDLYDLSVTHWEWDPGTVGEYAAARRTTPTDAYGGSLPVRWHYGEPIFEVEAGGHYAFPFTLENAGPATPTVETTLVLSTDAYIDTSDRQIGWLWDWARPGDPVLSRYGVILPTDVAPGRYYVGAIFDSADAVAEANEDNNASYIAVVVR